MYRSIMQRRNCIWGESFDPKRTDNKEYEITTKTPEEEDRIWKSLKNIFLFKSIPPEDLDKLIGLMQEMYFEPGDVVVREGEENDFLYVLDSGVFEAVKEQEDGTRRVLQTYEQAGHFGELALLHELPAAATVTALSPGRLWALERPAFRKTVLGGAYRRSELLEGLLGKVPLLAGLTEHEKSRLAEACVETAYSDGEKILAEGDAADSVYFVLSGSVRLARSGEADLKRLYQGDYFGELALLSRSPRQHAAYAVGSTRLARLEVVAFERLLGPCHCFMEDRLSDYQERLVGLFGPTLNLTALRK